VQNRSYFVCRLWQRILYLKKFLFLAYASTAREKRSCFVCRSWQHTLFKILHMCQHRVKNAAVSFAARGNAPFEKVSFSCICVNRA
jgi:hypothetical protein